ncbi:type I glyceraldehyde-3-phosphate dehydrogenase, partial [Desulfobulbus sp. TB]|nr:type I glyceraldehyde-3-phosphate dehydrogenase [Desulfobulbus sp. TB]
MTVRIGINGFGRIGRNIFRALSEDEAFADIEVVGINDLTDNKTIAHLLKYDSVMGVSRADITSTDKGIIVDGKEIQVSNHRNPADILWKEIGAEYILECTGFFRDQDSAGAHIDAGASKVIISAPAKGGVKTFVMGVNEDEYDPTEHHIVSNASCTTNCLA